MVPRAKKLGFTKSCKTAVLYATSNFERRKPNTGAINTKIHLPGKLRADNLVNLTKHHPCAGLTANEREHVTFLSPVRRWSE